MNDITEGIGGAIEGGLAARAVEPRHGEAAHDGESESETCSNCGTTVMSTYCPECGQRRHVHRTLSAIGHDLIHGVLHLDGKFWRTLPLLVFKPGRLTRRYIEGERAKFVSPMAMFLFSVFAMFAVFQLVGLSVPADLEGGAMEMAQEKGETQLQELRSQLEAMPANDPDRREAESKIATIEEGLAEFRQNENVQIGDDGKATFTPTGIDWIDEGLVKKWTSNPSLMVYKLQANAYKFSWLLIPLSVPFVWLTFAWRRRFHAYDHAIFVTYSLAFMSLLLISLSALGAAGAPTAFLVLAGGLIPPIHIYKQLRGAYEIGRFSALWRLLSLSVFIWIVIILFVQALVVLGAF